MKRVMVLALSLIVTSITFSAPVFGIGTAQEGDVKGLKERVEKLEKRMEGDKGLLGKWTDKITLSGAVEVEASYEDIDFDDPSAEDEDSSDITLATVELGVDVDIIKHVKGHVLFLWEEDDTEPVDLDEGIIRIDGEDVVPLFVDAGKLYVPFGYFESHFISDPLTLELGETRETAVVAGFKNDWGNLCAGAFNGDIDETGEDNHIESFVASGIFTLPEKTVPGLGFMAGVSWISNIADSDNLQDEDGVDGASIKDYVGGLSAFISASLMDKFFLEAEYLGATEEFEAGELSFDGGKAFEPKTWNIELACLITEDLEVGVRYEGSDDCGTFLPERQYGGVITYGIFESTSLSLEYLHGEFENDDKRNLLTAQFAIEF
jgi:hypothetical protein